MNCPAGRTIPSPGSVDPPAPASGATTTNHLPVSAPAQGQGSTTPLLEESALILSEPKLEFPKMSQSLQKDGVPRERALSLSVQQQDLNHNNIHPRRLSSAVTTSCIASQNQQSFDSGDNIVVRRRNSAVLAVTSTTIAAAAVMVANRPSASPPLHSSNHLNNRSMETVPDEDEDNEISEDESSGSLIQAGPVQLILREISADSFATFL